MLPLCQYVARHFPSGRCVREHVGDPERRACRVLICKNWREHRWWIAGLIAGTVLTILLYRGAVSETGWADRPTGSTGWLFWFGVLGGSICLFEFLLWPRKHYRVWRLGAV